MKQFLNIFILILFAFSAQAQIVMEPADLPVLGTTLTVGNTVNPGIDVQGPGAGLTWDFTTLVPGATSEVEFLDIAGTDGEADFASSDMARLDGLGNILGINIADLFPGAVDLPATAYFSYDSDGHVILDGAFADLVVPGVLNGPQALEADPDIVYLPLLQFGESLSDNGRFQIPIDLDSLDVAVRIDIERDFTVDAWGTLLLPDFSYDVLRIREVSTAVPSVGLLVGPIFIPIDGVIPDTTFVVESYSFIAEDLGYPVATARTVPDSISILSIEYHVDSTAAAIVEADYAILVTCLDIEMNDNSLNATMWNWDFGDGNFSTDENPMHTYDAAGDYTITLIASNSSTSDTISEIITVTACAEAEANFAILIDCLDIELSNNSVNADSYVWDFGDGNSSSDENPMHSYAEGGEYTVSLIATNSFGSDTITEIYNLVDCDTTSSIISYELDYELYPNPSYGEFTISLDEVNTSIEISDILGRQLYSERLEAGDNNIRLEGQVEGIYFLSIRNEKGLIITTEKLLVR